MWRAVAAVLACVVIAGCGGDEPDPESPRHLDPRSDAVISLSLDYDGASWQQVKRLYARGVQEGVIDEGEFTPPTLDGALSFAVGQAGLSFADDVRPLLGGTLHVGVRVEPAEPLSAQARDILERLDLDATRFDREPPEYVGRDGRPLTDVTPRQVQDALDELGLKQPDVTVTASYRAEDAKALERLLGKLRDQGLEPRPIDGIADAERLEEGLAIAGGDTLVLVLPGDEQNADRLLRERLTETGDGPQAPVLEEGDLLAARAAPTVLGNWLDREELARALATAAGRALRGAEAHVRLDDDALRADARVDFEGLAELPLPAAAPLALPREEAVASASADQSATTVFLAGLARELYPDSRFVRRVERYEQEAGVRFEDEVLRQFAGPSFTVLRPGDGDGEGEVAFGARSSLRDPAAMRAQLDTLAPALPGILEGLQGLGSFGLTGLLFVAPDAPLTPSAFALLAQVGVSRLPGTGADALYEVRGLDENGRAPGPDRVVYGIVGDAFVVASSPELAREVAAMETEPAPEAATRLRALVPEVAADLADRLDLGDAELLRTAIERVEASASAQDGDVVGEAEVRWAR